MQAVLDEYPSDSINGDFIKNIEKYYDIKCSTVAKVLSFEKPTLLDLRNASIAEIKGPHGPTNDYFKKIKEKYESENKEGWLIFKGQSKLGVGHLMG